MPASHASTVEPRPAATVVLLRDGTEGLETFLTVRPHYLRFMGGATVFPGGAVAEPDLDPRWEGASVLDGTQAADLLGDDDPRRALGFFVCALREAFEEVGFVAGAGPVGELAPQDAEDPATFLQRCLESGVVLATDRLVPAGRWVTPIGAPVRFDTRFFVAVANEEWVPTLDPQEVESAAWVGPAEALRGLAESDRLMAPPTVEMLQRLEAFEDAADAVATLGRRGLAGAGNVLSIRLSPLVHVILAPNPGVMTGPGTNTYVVGTGPTVVIDPAVDDDEYLDAVLEASGKISEILVTHRHSDHVGGVASLVERTSAPVRAWGSEPAGGVAVAPLGDGEVVEAGTARLTAIHTPGHASDHVCFSLEGAASLFAGDNVLGEGTAVIAPPDGNMGDYLQTLERLEALGPDRIYPGHFRPLDGGTAVIRGYIEHRKAREAAILEALAAGAASVDELVPLVYTDVDPSLHPIARYSVLAHLEMCRDRGRVRQEDDRWALVEAT